MQTKNKVYNVYYSQDGEQIEQTQIDENNEELAWELFKEFGHERNDGSGLVFEEDYSEEGYKDEQFQIYNEGAWMNAESVDFEF